MEAYDAEFRGAVVARAMRMKERVRSRSGFRFPIRGCGGSSSSVARRVRWRRKPPRQPQWHAWADWLLAKLAARPDIYLRELQAELKAERDVDVCLTTIGSACRALDQSRKKRR